MLLFEYSWLNELLILVIWIPFWRL